MTALIIGLDGGGTSTRCVVVSETGEVAGRGRAGGANVVSVADPAANLLAALRAAMDGLDPALVAGGVFGLAGSGAERARRLAGEAWRSAGLPGHPSVVADVLVAFASATAEPDGTVLIAGTGAVAARIARWEIAAVADGHGWLVGDEGSGVWIGRRAVTAALKSLDGRAGPTVLLDRLAALGTSVGDIVSTVYAQVADSGPAWLATFAPLVDAAAREGDEAASAILDEAACRLAATARALGPGEGPLVLAGSLLTQPTELARRVRAEFGDAARPIPARDGAAGAAALALRAAFPSADLHRRVIGECA
ncbi:BadF/BadG/BcrA/BcrD ATPase family protein [Acrocarpospora macrocephala]|uniref:N-acetylglucosamine kinase n=1 Tax=Acrocarpospora macrocephala TaxID=150177 RepID=A0A5M3X6M6_9ACTN|nr:BadF/BadG/BcrA/BcrD ATPase family protein [Acrocarpospora macrocephala]GES16302.1 N-acetylglucosamine kinase [Acrocarpospora macrocephala]